jgi:hypothetical protein
MMDLIDDDGTEVEDIEVIDGSTVTEPEQIELSLSDIDGMKKLLQSEMAKLSELKRGITTDIENTFLVMDVLLAVLEGRLVLKSTEEDVMHWGAR